MTILQELRIFLSYSLAQMQHLKQTGQITDRLYGHYCFLWLWSADRSDYRHERYYQRMGSEAYWRRIDRVKKIVDFIRSVELPPSDRIPFRVGSPNP